MAETNDRYFDRWQENTGVGWWNDGRKQLNAVIDKVNQWTLGGCPEEDAELLLRNVDMGLQTFAARDGGSGWADELQEIRRYVLSRYGHSAQPIN